MPEPCGVSAFFPYMMPSLATFLTGVAMVFFAAKMEIYLHEVRVYAITCVLISLSILPRIAGGIAADHGLFLEIPYLLSVLVVFVAPLTGHLVHAVRGRHGLPLPIVVIYAVTAVYAVISAFAGDVLPHATGWLVLCTGPMALLSGLFSAGTTAADHKRTTSLHINTVISGSVVLLLIIILDSFIDHAFAPLNFAFVPMMIIAAGLFGREGAMAGNKPGRVELVSAIIVALGLMPIMADMIIITSSASSFPKVAGSPWQLGFITASTVSLVACTGMALFCNRRAGWRIDVILVSVAAMLAAILNLRDIIGVLLHEELTRIILMNDVFLALFIGVMVHLAVVMSGRSRRGEVVFFYGMSILFIGLMLFEAAVTGERSGGATVSARGMGHYLFIAAGIAALIRSMWILAGVTFRGADPVMKRKASLALIGYVLICIIVASSVVLALFKPLYSINFLAFIPMMFLAWGAFLEDLLRINTHMKRQIISSVLRGILLVLYAVGLVLVALLLRRYPPEFLVSRVVPYGIPPFLSFVSAAFLSLFVLGLEKNRTVTLPFSLICFCYAVLNLDILLVGIVPDVSTALLISRIDHFFLAMLLLGANIHLVFLITEKKDQWWKVYLAYTMGLVMAPLTFTPWYFQGMYTYYWGFFARKAVLYDVMSTLWMSALMYVIYLLFTSLRKGEALQRRNIRNVMISFMLIAAMSMANTPAIYGYEIYPLGTFIFIALFFLAYGLFKFNPIMAMQYVRTTLFWAGLILMLMGVGLAPLMVFHDKAFSLSGGIFLVAVLYTPVRNSWDAVLNLFIRKTTDVLHDSYLEFTAGLSHVHHLNDLHTMIRSWIFRVFDALSCTSIFFSRDCDSYDGWTTLNDRMSSGLFGKPGDHIGEDTPVTVEKDHYLIRLCSEEKRVLNRDLLFRRHGKEPFLDWREGPFRNVEIILPVLAHDRLVAVFLVGGKVDGSRYSVHEADVLANMGLFLGPHVENAKLLENLEQEVDDRTRDLNQALAEAMVKEKQIIERNLVIERQNQVSEVLLETSTKLHNMEGLDELFSFTLTQLRTLFPDLRGGIILQGSGRNLIEASAFVGLSDDEQRVILETRTGISDPDFHAMLGERMDNAGEPCPGHRSSGWKVFPLMGRGEKAAGSMILNGKDLDGPAGETVHLFIAQISAVVQSRLLLIYLERMASTDGLTGVYNRSFLDRELEKAIKHARRFRNMWFSLMIIDVNGLKQINDTYGHGAGDMVIGKVAVLLKTACRETDIVARIGGDEFAVLMPSTNRVQAEILLSRIRSGEKNLTVVFSPSGSVHITVPIRISIGLASSDEDEPELVMKVADDLMYADKQRFYADQTVALVIVRK